MYVGGEFTIGEAVDHIRRRISELGLKRKPVCYAASEALYHLAGGKAAGLTAMRLKIDGETESHWFVRGPWGEIFDLTAGQYPKPIDYSKAIGTGFYPNISNLAKELMK